MLTVKLTDVQGAYLRELLYEDLTKGAAILQEQAENAAFDGNAGRPNVAGDDAHGTWCRRLGVTAGLLDVFGWSVGNDVATIVKFERENPVDIAEGPRELDDQEGGAS